MSFQIGDRVRISESACRTAAPAIAERIGMEGMVVDIITHGWYTVNVGNWMLVCRDSELELLPFAELLAMSKEAG